MNGQILLVDGNSILNRAFYGIGGTRILTNREGFATNAIHGFMTILLKYISPDAGGGSPYTHVAVAFDLKAPTFRHRRYAEYKAGRKPMPPELAMQFPKMKEILDAWGIARVELEGYEADDIIGTLSAVGEAAGMNVTILTGDRDSYQLVSAKTHISMPSTRGGKTEYEEVTPGTLMEKYGLRPDQMIELKALMGDSSDNIPGIKGVGEKTALELLHQYGSLEGIFDNAENITKAALKAKISSGRESAELSLWLGTICRTVPGVPTLDDIGRHPMDRAAMYRLMRELELNKLTGMLGLTPGDDVPERRERQLRSMDEKTVGIGDAAGLGSAASLYVYADMDGTGIHRSLRDIAFSDGETVFKADRDLVGCSDPDVWRRVFDTGAAVVSNDIKGLYIWLRSMGVSLSGDRFDTGVAAYMCDANRQRSYDVLTEEYLGAVAEAVPETQMSLFAGDEPSDGSPCAERARLMPDLADALTDAMQETGAFGLFQAVEMPLVGILADMELRGMDVDREALAALGAEYDRRISGLEETIYDLAGERFNINSPAQLGNVLFEKMGMQHGRKTRTGYSTDAETLEKLAPFHPIIRAILRYRQMAKLNGTYVRGLNKFIDPETGRIHTTFNQTVTATGRLSSQDPNLQNIPVRTDEGREIRRVFTCRPGQILISADYSQIELRVLAHVADDQVMKEIFNRGGDIHTDTAAKVFGVEPEEVTSSQRRAAKAVNFGIVYGISEFGLSKDLDISYGQARDYIAAYLANFKGVASYMERIVAEAQRDGYVTTFMGRRRYIPELKSGNHNTREFGKRVALNAPIQGAAADIIKIAMIRVSEQLAAKCPGAELVLQVHDELLVRCDEEDYPMVVNILRDAMENAVKLSVPLTVDVGSGSNWLEV